MPKVHVEAMLTVFQHVLEAVHQFAQLLTICLCPQDLRRDKVNDVSRTLRVQEIEFFLGLPPKVS